MLLRNLDSYKILFLFLPIGLVGCNGQGYSQPSIIQDSLVVNCFVLKPIINDSKADSLRDFEFGNESLRDFLDGIFLARKPVTYDSSMDFITSFEFQKKIILNYDCFPKLNNPDSCNLISIYFNSGFPTWVKKKSVVQFLKSYKKNINKFGSVIVFEYQFNNVAEVEPHFMYIIISAHNKEEDRAGKDYMGIVLCCDGLNWKDYHDQGYSVPIFIQMIRRTKDLQIPLYYDQGRFIPIGHYKGEDWQD